MINNKCKNCGGELNYDPESGELKCKNCECIVDIPEQNASCNKKNLTSSSSIKESKVEYTQIKCNTCGNSHTIPYGQDLITCPSCGDSNFEKKINVDYLPDGIIPFKIDKEKALNCFVDWLKHRKFTPNNLKKFASAESLQGIYLPIYNYDFSCSTFYSGIGINENRDAEGRVHITKTHFSDTHLNHFENYISSATKDIPSHELTSIANFDYSNIYVYRTEFLYGFAAKTVDISLQENFNTAKNIVANNIKREIEFRLGYDRIENFICQTTFSNVKYNYLYVPIWTSFYTYKNKKYKFYINGTTGKVTGKTPKSFFKIFGVVMGVILGIAGLALLFSLL